MWARISRIEGTERTSADHTQRMYKFQCKVGDKVFEELKTYNQMLDWVDRDLHKDDMFAFESIKAHRLHPDPTGEKKMDLDNAPRGSYQLLVEWASGETTWVNYKIIFDNDLVSVALYAKRNGLLSTPGWKNCKRFIHNSKALARMANQAKLHNHRLRPKYKYGVQVPRNHDEAVWIDNKNGNTSWQDAEKVELDQLREYETFRDLGKGAAIPDGFKKIPCHMVCDFKANGRHKARFVGGGHRTDTPIGSIYSGVVSLPGIWIVTAIAELNDLQIWGTDVGKAYLESVTQEKIVFVAGEEFGELAGHLFQIVKELYRLKSSGKKWHKKLRDVLRDLGFEPSMVDDDI